MGTVQNLLYSGRGCRKADTKEAVEISDTGKGTAVVLLGSAHQ